MAVTIANGIDITPPIMATIQQIAQNSLILPSPDESTFYLVVPYANRVRPPQVEGSYGLRGDGTERPPALQACRPQWIVACP